MDRERLESLARNAGKTRAELAADLKEAAARRKALKGMETRGSMSAERIREAGELDLIIKAKKEAIVKYGREVRSDTAGQRKPWACQRMSVSGEAYNRKVDLYDGI